MFSKLLRKIIFPNSYSNEAYIRYLRSKHIKVGKGCIFYSPNKTSIDVERGHMLTIGDYVKVTSGVKILTHDYSRSVLCNMEGYGDVGEAGNTTIGNNVFIGVDAIILMGTTIGDNSIIGAGSVVSGEFPSNVVVAGNPAKVISSIDYYYEKRKKKELSAAKEYVKQWRQTYGIDPSIRDMTNSFMWLYLPRTENTINEFADMFQLNGVDLEKYKKSFLSSIPEYESFEAFLEDCNN